MPKSVTSENILKLRELSDRLCETPNNEYKLIVKKLKQIVDCGMNEIEKSLTPQSKIKCYESMCATITNLLTTINIK